MKVTKITLEDKGQDFLELYVDDKGEVVDARPFQSSIWAGAYIPIGVGTMVEVGKPARSITRRISNSGSSSTGSRK